MIKKNIFIVTGSSGEIGSAIANKLSLLNYEVLGIDVKINTKVKLDHFLNINLNKLCIDDNYRNKKFIEIKEIINKKKLIGLINCAAIQITKEFDNLSLDDLQVSINTNVLSIFVLVKQLKNNFCNQESFIINISSIHSKLSKSKFLAYSFSKSALDGMSKAMAIELGDKLNIVSISPAAIDTKMLLDGLGNKKLVEKVKNFHPTKTIGHPDDIVKIVTFIITNKIRFLNGSNISMDGGISHRLHDIN